MIDERGLYVQMDNDKGDCPHRTGLAAALTALNGDIPMARSIAANMVSNLMLIDGRIIRHPEPLLNCKWQADPRCTSRDQASRFILGCCVVGFKISIRRWLWSMAKRGFFHQNNLSIDGNWKFPDLIGLGEISNVIRGLNLWYFYPLLLLLDINWILSFILRSRYDGSSLCVPDIVYSRRKFPTPFSIIAFEIIRHEWLWCAEAIENHSAKNNGCLELTELFTQLREKI